MTMVIQPWYNQTDIEEVITMANGILLPGGDRDLDLNKHYEQNAKYVVKRAMELHDAGKSIPIWGTCQGFRLLHSIFMETPDLSNVTTFNYPNKIKIRDYKSRIFKYFSQEDLKHSENARIFPHFNNFGISRIHILTIQS
jgi:gamma-glutamyl hydrolase